MSRTHRVHLDWIFERVSLDSALSIRYVRTTEQLSEMLTKRCMHCTTQWTSLMQLFDVHPPQHLWRGPLRIRGDALVALCSAGRHERRVLPFQCNAKEHDTLPRGPVEAGSWWYAESRFGVANVPHVVLLKDDGAVFLVHDRLHDGPLQQDPGFLHHKALRGYCDVGPHFHYSRFLAWIVMHALETYSFDEVPLLLSRKVMASAPWTVTSAASPTRSSAPLTRTPKA